jgi:alkylation response protein AidB-like acyl-CoA dehydrogenase
MDLLPSEEQNQIVSASVSFLENELPVERIHKVDETHPLLTRDLLAKMAGLGWFGLGLPEADGGVGYGLREEVLLFIELGRFLVSPAVLGSVIGAHVATLAGKKDLALSILSGEKLVGVALASHAQKPEVAETVSGIFYVFEAHDADLILVADEQGLALIDKSAVSVYEKIPCMDEKMQMALLSLDTFSTQASVAASQNNIYLRGVLLTAAMQLGIAQATRDRSVAYAKVREQYGKPIGAFQAIKHYCAEMAVKCESVMSMVYHAAIVLNDTHGPYGENYRFDTIASKALASQAAQDNANTAVQVHGGMGFTQEMDIHLFVKRAHVLDQLFGGKRKQLKNLIRLAGPVL